MGVINMSNSSVSGTLLRPPLLMTTCGTRCWEVEISTLWTFPPNRVLSEYIKGWEMTMSQHYTVWKRSSSTRAQIPRWCYLKHYSEQLKPGEQGARATVDILSSDRVPHKWIFTVFFIPSANSRNIRSRRTENDVTQEWSGGCQSKDPRD